MLTLLTTVTQRPGKIELKVVLNSNILPKGVRSQRPRSLDAYHTAVLFQNIISRFSILF